MDSPLSNIDDLLSGMLDGILTDAEARQLEDAMEKDSSIQLRLDDLSEIRKSLLSSRPKGFLGADFAKSVTEGARARAKMLGPDAPSWLAESGGKTSTSAPKVSLPSSNFGTVRPWLYVAALASAAVIALVFMLPSKDDGLSLVGQLPKGEIQEPLEPVEKVGAEELLASELPAGVPSNEESSLAENSTPKTQEGTSDSSRIALGNSEKNERSRDEAAESVKPMAELAENSVKAVPNASSQTTTRVNVVAVLDFSMDATAIENSALEMVLEKHGIAFASDLNISEEQLKALEDSRMIGKAQESERIGVMFLKGSAKNVSLAMMDIIGQYKDFPECSMNMATDKASRTLVKQLSSIEVAGDKGGVAQSLTVAGVSGKSPFPASARRGMIFSKEMREQELGVLFPKESAEVSYALLLIRPPKAK